MVSRYRPYYSHDLIVSLIEAQTILQEPTEKPAYSHDLIVSLIEALPFRRSLYPLSHYSHDLIVSLIEAVCLDISREIDTPTILTI